MLYQSAHALKAMWSRSSLSVPVVLAHADLFLAEANLPRYCWAFLTNIFPEHTHTHIEPSLSSSLLACGFANVGSRQGTTDRFAIIRFAELHFSAISIWLIFLNWPIGLSTRAVMFSEFQIRGTNSVPNQASLQSEIRHESLSSWGGA